MIKGVLGQPNFSLQTNTTQLFPKINTNFNNLSSVKVNTNISSCVKLDEWDKLEFSGKKEQKVLNYCVVFVWGEKLGWPRTLFIILLNQHSYQAGK